MATVNFRIRSKADKEVSIYSYLSLGRNNMIQVKTNFNIHPDNWKTLQDHLAKNKAPRDSNQKLLFNSLNKLSSYLHEKLNEAERDNLIVDKNWLEKEIAECFGKTTKKEEKTNLLTNHIQHIIDTANTRKIKGQTRVGLSERRVKGYESFFKVVLNFEKHLNKTIRFQDINKQLVDKFTDWLMNTEQYSKNYTGKTLDNLKTVCVDADSLEIKVNPYFKNITGFKEDSDERNIVILSFDELEQIKNTVLPNQHLENTRKWLLLGCHIGQRGGDLLKITADNLRAYNDTLLIDLVQDKTGKHVTVAVLDNDIRKFLEHDFPTPLTSQKFNSYLKKLCEVCEINEPTEGKKKQVIGKEIDPVTKKEVSKLRLVSGTYPKYELVASHVCRRSFATNYYKKVPTAILKTITGHTKESQFLEYIGKPIDKDENAMLFKRFFEEIHLDG